jgi:hypothetical protein
MAKHNSSTPLKSKTNQTILPSDAYDYPVFSFQHLTPNKTYTFEYFNDVRDAREAAHSLLEKLIESSSRKITELLTINKIQGFETIPHANFNNKLFIAGVPIPLDTKLYVMRFNKQNARLICFKARNVPNLFYIVAFDFDHSIYDHG